MGSFRSSSIMWVRSSHCADQRVTSRQAGVVGDAPALDTDLDRYRAMFEVNVVAPLAMVQAFAPLLVAAANDVGGRRSVVVNVGSFTMHGAPWNGAYVSTKVRPSHAGLSSAPGTDGLRRRWAHSAIACGSSSRAWVSASSTASSVCSKA